MTLSIFAAILLAALLHPVFRRLNSALPRGLAAAITVLGTLAVLAGLMTFVGTQFASQLPDITTQVGEGIDQIRALWNGELTL